MTVHPLPAPWKSHRMNLWNFGPPRGPTMYWTGSSCCPEWSSGGFRRDGHPADPGPRWKLWAESQGRQETYCSGLMSGALPAAHYIAGSWLSASIRTSRRTTRAGHHGDQPRRLFCLVSCPVAGGTPTLWKGYILHPEYGLVHKTRTECLLACLGHGRNQQNAMALRRAFYALRMQSYTIQ